MSYSLAIITAVKMIIIILSLSLVCAKVARLYWSVRRSRDDGNMNEVQAINLKNHFSLVRATFIQAIAYILALFITIMAPFLLIFIPGSKNKFILTFDPILLPLQGMFNFFIFSSAKVYHLRKADSELSIVKALRLIMFKGSFEDDVEAVVLSGVSSALGRGGGIPSNLSYSSEPHNDDASEGKQNDFNDNISYAQESQEQRSSAYDSAWDNISWRSRSTINQTFENSEDLSRGLSRGLSDGLSSITR